MARFVCSACQVSVESPQQRVKCPQCRAEMVGAGLLKEPVSDTTSRFAQSVASLTGSAFGVAALIFGGAVLFIGLAFILFFVIGFIASR
jgi:hypothetical protein